MVTLARLALPLRLQGHSNFIQKTLQDSGNFLGIDSDGTSVGDGKDISDAYDYHDVIIPPPQKKYEPYVIMNDKKDLIKDLGGHVDEGFSFLMDKIDTLNDAVSQMGSTKPKISSPPKPLSK